MQAFGYERPTTLAGRSPSSTRTAPTPGRSPAGPT